MSTIRYASVLGLGFGDCGKGRFIDALTRRWHAHTVVRFNGGGQAGHNVITPAEAGASARHHTFSQFGAGTFVPGTRTVLLAPMIVHPTALLAEAEVLASKGVHDALSRLTIDATCRITTPYHQAAGRLRERLRGEAAHGTCGVGVGETVRHALTYPDQAIRYADLAPTSSTLASLLVERLQILRQSLLAEFAPHCQAGSPRASCEEYQTLQDDALAAPWLNAARAITRQCPPASAETLYAQLTQPGCVLFEGAQGVLLDEWRGFHPHTTWSTISTTAVEAAAARIGITQPIEHYGALRTYLTRHGAGPLPTHDPALDAHLPEPHNTSAGWQGHFRRGHPDAVLLRYALDCVGPLSGLLVSHLDVFQNNLPLKWCESYTTSSSENGPQIINCLPASPTPDLQHQSKLTDLLSCTLPKYAAAPIASAAAFLDHIASITPLPILLTSHGPLYDEVSDG